MGWHNRGIYGSYGPRYLVFEQFWGRAVQASHDPYGVKGRFFFGVDLHSPLDLFEPQAKQRCARR
jgi:hypothetical protein